MTKRKNTVAWGLLALALALWCAVVYIGLSITGSAHDRREAAINATHARESAGYAQRLSVLAEGTKTEREALDKIVGADIATYADIIERVGERAGLSVRVENAVPENIAAQNDAPAKSVIFIIESQGTFSNLLRTAAYLENIPLPSNVQQLEFERVQSRSAQPWFLTARIRVYTTTPITS
ncbi:hypothetical protein HY970_03870 [Candidatus Kaiserbacteria bacterium]|nr:hypothetical protein [Candidatus Kaiserbacteria bacterium]